VEGVRRMRNVRKAARVGGDGRREEMRDKMRCGVISDKAGKWGSARKRGESRTMGKARAAEAGRGGG
jgi:hypothetical protein